MNGALLFIPGEVHLIFHGPVLEKLSREERVALIGHELAHYKLWSIEDGTFHIANQILDHGLAYPGARASHTETARLYRLYTELYADRGGALAVGQTAPAMAILVKTMTGLTNVDAASYLKQAAELDAAGSTSQGNSHPEAFLRAQAVDRWWNGDAELNSWTDARLRGPLSLAMPIANFHCDGGSSISITCWVAGGHGGGGISFISAPGDLFCLLAALGSGL